MSLVYESLSTPLKYLQEDVKKIILQYFTPLQLCFLFLASLSDAMGRTLKDKIITNFKVQSQHPFGGTEETLVKTVCLGCHCIFQYEVNNSVTLIKKTTGYEGPMFECQILETFKEKNIYYYKL